MLIGMAVISLPRHSEPENLTEKVAAEVRALMGRYGVTQTALGGILGISQPQASARYHGKVAFKLDELGVLADYFGVSPAELLGERVSPRPGGPDGGDGGVVRHQGLEPRTRWYEAFAA
jgi:transcriptional regulator with XRE-family HTH domain